MSISQSYVLISTPQLTCSRFRTSIQCGGGFTLVHFSIKELSLTKLYLPVWVSYYSTSNFSCLISKLSHAQSLKRTFAWSTQPRQAQSSCGNRSTIYIRYDLMPHPCLCQKHDIERYSQETISDWCHPDQSKRSFHSTTLEVIQHLISLETGPGTSYNAVIKALKSIRISFDINRAESLN